MVRRIRSTSLAQFLKLEVVLVVMMRHVQYRSPVSPSVAGHTTIAGSPVISPISIAIVAVPRTVAERQGLCLNGPES
jgi:hypothetical protein